MSSIYPLPIAHLLQDKSTKILQYGWSIPLPFLRNIFTNHRPSSSAPSLHVVSDWLVVLTATVSLSVVGCTRVRAPLDSDYYTHPLEKETKELWVYAAHGAEDAVYGTFEW